MAHQTYTIPAYVLGGLNVNEGSRSLALYTQEFGLIHAFARSVRENRSKLRFGLQPLMYSQVSLVRGKDRWHLTGAQECVSYARIFVHEPEKLKVIARTFRSVSRLIRGEEPQAHIFELLSQVTTFLSGSDFSEEELSVVECLVVLRLLELLGYAVPERHWSTSDFVLSRNLLEEKAPHKSDLIVEINAGLLETHL